MGSVLRPKRAQEDSGSDPLNADLIIDTIRMEARPAGGRARWDRVKIDYILGWAGGGGCWPFGGGC
jgi:hypothetical protein